MVQPLTFCRANKGGGEVYSGKGCCLYLIYRSDTVRTRYAIENINFIRIFRFLLDGVN